LSAEMAAQELGFSHVDPTIAQFAGRSPACVWQPTKASVPQRMAVQTAKRISFLSG
jgi:hypothetical protein